MFKKLVNNKKASLILLAVLFGLFVIYSIIGITVGKNWHRDEYTLYTRGGGYGFIYVPIVGVLIAFEALFTLCFVYEKVSFKAYRIISMIFYFLLFGALLTQTLVYALNILKLDYYEKLHAMGVLTFMAIVLTCLFAFLLFVFNFFCLLVTPNKSKEKKVSQDASSAVQRLKTLKELFDNGVISEEEYNEKKKKYIDLL